ncbi:MAG: response regulator [Chlorobi bacterium]|nr:response regulator [Chlorobiota bacterium]
MKLNVKLLLITFSIVLLVTVTSTVILYSVTNTFFNSQNSKLILKSTNDFVFLLQTSYNQLDESFNSIYRGDVSGITSETLKGTGIDFIFGKKQNGNEYFILKDSQSAVSTMSREEFLMKYPNAIIKESIRNGEPIFYGQLITAEFLDELSKKIDAEVSLIIDDSPFLISNETKNAQYLFTISNSIKKLKRENNFDLFNKRLEDVDFWASYYVPRTLTHDKAKTGFLIFRTPKEGVEYAAQMKLLIIIILVSGAAISIIFVLLMTTKIRKQISYFSETAMATVKGDLDKRIPILLKDEIGSFGETFNKMLDELQRKEIQEKEYSEFLVLLNQNPTIKKISETSLEKIISAGSFTFGALYLIEEERTRLIATYGIGRGIAKSPDDIDVYGYAIKKKEPIDFTFDKNPPIIRSGTIDIPIKSLFIFPIIFNNEVIGIIELASKEETLFDIKEYFKKIHHQLAIGLMNARSLEQLENLVKQLRELNEDYQKQNEQIRKQNKELLELHQQLQAKAAELEKQKLKAEELTRVKSQFLANMSHELRTPLSSILGLSELVMNDRATLPKTRERMSVVLRNGNKLLSLINNILEFSKSDAGAEKLNVNEFLLSDFISELQTFIKPLAAEKDLDFIVDTIKQQDVVLKTDKSKMERIFINLLGNAVKFTNEGFVQFKVEFIGDDGILFSIKDTGIGIPETERENIFEEFRQVNNETTRENGGTGLGLAICKKYVNLLHGKLSFRSKENEGTEFIVSFSGVIVRKIDKPLVESDFTQTEREEARKIVLLINSNNEIHRIIGNYLSDNKLELISSETASDGFRKIVELKPDYTILDVDLPDENGWSLLNKIRKETALSEIPVILTKFSANSNLGYGFLMDDVKSDTNLWEDLRKEISSFNQLEQNSIFVVNGNEKEYIPIRSSVDAEFHFHNNKEFKLLTDIFINHRPKLVIIHAAENDFDELEFIDELKNDLLTKGIKIWLALPDKLSEKAVNKLIDKSEKILKARNLHRFDVLRILRDRMHLEFRENIKTNLIKEGGEKNNFKFEDNSLVSEERKIKVLIVDDDPDTLFTVGEMIETLGYETRFAGNGVECLISLSASAPDLILLDIMMPQMDGFETIKRIKANDETKHIPVFALTAHAMLDDKDIIERNGFIGLITKPVNRLELAFRIKEIISKGILNKP